MDIFLFYFLFLNNFFDILWSKTMKWLIEKMIYIALNNKNWSQRAAPSGFTVIKKWIFLREKKLSAALVIKMSIPSSALTVVI